MLANAIIRDIVFYYRGRDRSMCFEVTVVMRNDGGAVIQIPMSKMEDFLSLFKDQVDMEDGIRVDKLRGVPMVVKIRGDIFTKIVAVGNIFANGDELLELEDKQ